jgi:hypothetical protein
VIVSRVEEGTSAASRIQRGDVIREVNRQKVET